MFWLICRYLKLNPKYKTINDEECLSQASTGADTVVEASFKFMIYDQSNGKHREQLGKVANYSH